MSWGDQILDELGMVDLKNRQSRSKLDKDVLRLYVFAMWLAKRRKLSISDEELEREVESFLKEGAEPK